MFGNRRSARGEPAEIDPRFIQDGRNIGVSRKTSHGSVATLDGTQRQQVQKLIKCNNEKDMPWSVAVSSVLPAGASIGTARLGALAKGTVGNGATTVNVEFDCTPDTFITLPGAFIDIDVGWSPWLTLLAGNVFSFDVPANLPSSLEVRAVASVLSVPARGTAARTFFIDSTVGAGGPWRTPVPPFADVLHVYCQADADYANITSLVFAASSGIVTYTGAQLLALKNAGQGVPVPGNAFTANLTLAAALGNTYFTYDLSL